MKKEIHNFVDDYVTCQWHKGKIVKPLGELQLLSFPSMVQTDISMDFNVKLPNVGKKSLIMVVEHLCKYAYFYSLQNLVKVSIIAYIFMDNVFKLLDMPTLIVTNHDPTSTSTNLCLELFRLQGTQLNLSTS